MTPLIMSKEEMDDIKKIVKSPEESVLLIKGVTETIENEAKERNGRFPSMILSNNTGNFILEIKTADLQSLVF